MVLFSSCLSAQCPLSIIFLYNPLNLIYSSNVLIILSMKIFLLSFCHKTPLSLIFTPPCLPSSSLLVHFLLLWIVDPCGEQAKQRSSDLSLSLSLQPLGHQSIFRISERHLSSISCFCCLSFLFSPVHTSTSPGFSSTCSLHSLNLRTLYFEKVDPFLLLSSVF